MERKKVFFAAAEKALCCGGAFALSLSEARCGVFPFGLALCCGARGNAASVFLGVFAASLFGGRAGLFRAAAAMLIFAARYIAGERGRNISPAGAFALSLAATAAVGAREFFTGNVLFDSVTRAACTLAILPLFAVLLSFYTPFAHDPRRRAHKLKRQISLLAWAFCAVRAVQAVDVGSVMPSLAVGMICAYAAGRESPFFGGMCGFAAGLAAGPVYIPVMCIAGMAYGVFCPDLKWFALVFSGLVSLSSGVYLTSLEGAFPEFFNLVAGVVAFAPISKRLPPPVREARPQSGSAAELKKMSAAFAAISEAFYTKDHAEAPRAELCASIKPELFARCEKCRKYTSCRIDKYDYVNHLTGLAASGDALPGYIGEQCPQAAALVKTAIGLAAKLKNETAARTCDRAENYMSFARILCSAGEKCESDRAADTDSSERVRRALEDAGLRFGSVTVRGGRTPELTVTDVDAESGATPESLRNAAAGALGVNMSAPELFRTAEGWEIRMAALPGLRIEYGRAMSGKAGETVSGDTAVAFESDDKRFFSLLADGMGSGADAAGASRLAALFMEKLILAGGDKKEALAMLNRMLLSRRDEVFTTVDLLEIDRMSGEASLIKAGAAPSYLFRTGKCWKIATDTPPAGVLDGMKVTQTSLRFRRGDVLVMLSDGACPEDGVPRLPGGKKTASACASAILESRRGREDADDMSVCVIKAV